MKKIYSCLLVITILTFFLSSCKEEVTAPVENKKYNLVKAAVDSVRTAIEVKIGKSIPSLNVMISTPAESYFVSSSSKSANVLTSGTYFRIASNTKTLAAVAILNMHEEGWLNIKDKVTSLIPGSSITYLPNTPEWNIPNKNSITIEQLLQHSAGVYDLVNDTVTDGFNFVDPILAVDPNHQFTAAEFAAELTKKPYLYYFQPGTDHHYSNTGYVFLSEIIERIYSFRKGANKTFSDYMQDHITGGTSPLPQLIKYPYLFSDNKLPSPYVKGLMVTQTGSLISDEINMSGSVAEGNGSGTIEQLNSFIRALISGNHVLKPETVELMKNSYSPGSSSYALGLTTRENLGYGHTGATNGYLSAMYHDPLTGVTCTVLIPMWDLTNMTNFNNLALAMLDGCYAARKALGFKGKL